MCHICGCYTVKSIKKLRKHSSSIQNRWSNSTEMVHDTGTREVLTWVNIVSFLPEHFYLSESNENVRWQRGCWSWGESFIWSLMQQSFTEQLLGARHCVWFCRLVVSCPSLPFPLPFISANHPSPQGAGGGHHWLTCWQMQGSPFGFYSA